jgi:hypothetical protein
MCKVVREEFPQEDLVRQVGMGDGENVRHVSFLKE